MLVLCFLLLCLGQLYQAAQAQHAFVCPREQGVFPHPENHTRFFRCVGGRPTLNVCASGVFSPPKGTCVQIEHSGETTHEPLSDESKAITFSSDSSALTFIFKASTTSSPDRSETVPSGPGIPPIFRPEETVTRASGNLSPGMSTNADTAATASLEPDKFADRKHEKRTHSNRDGSGLSPKPSSATSREGVVSSGNKDATAKPVPRSGSVPRHAHKRLLTQSYNKTTPKSFRYYDTENSSDQEKYMEKTRSKDEVGLFSDSDMYGGKKASEDLFLCPEESGFFPHQTNCSRFFWCLHGKASAMVCPLGEWFDPKKRICSRSQSTDDCASWRAPSAAHHRHQDSDDEANDVIQVSRDKRNVLSTSRRQARNVIKDDVHDVSLGPRSRRSIGHAHESDNASNPEAEPADKPEADNSTGSEEVHSRSPVGLEGGTLPVFQCPDDGFHADPDDCSSFYLCSHGRASWHSCQPGTSFHRHKRVCSWPRSRGGCGQVGSVPYSSHPHNAPAAAGNGNGNGLSDDFLCPDELAGFYAHPEDCRVFFQCAGGQAFRQQCGQGTAFNQEQGVCSWPVQLDTGCGATLEEPSDRRRSSSSSDHGALKDSAATTANHAPDKTSTETAPDDNQPAVENTEAVGDQILQRVYPETTREVVSSVPRKLVSSKSSTPTTPSSFLIRSPQTSLRETDEEGEHLPATENDPAELQTLHTDQRNEELLEAERNSLQKATIISSGFKAKQPFEAESKMTTGSRYSREVESIYPTKQPRTNQPTIFTTNQPTIFKTNQPTIFQKNPPTIFQKNQPTIFTTNQPTIFTTNQPTIFKTNHPTIFPTNQPSPQHSQNDVNSQPKSGKSRSVQMTVLWPWEKPSQEESDEEKTSTETPPTSETVPTAQTATKSTVPFSSSSPASVWYFSSALSSASTPKTKKTGTTSEDAHTVPSAKIPTVESATTASTDSPEDSQQVKAETYRVAATGTDFRCPFPTGHFRDPMNCAVYYRCMAGLAYRSDCPTGTLYHSLLHKCLMASQVTDCWTADGKRLKKKAGRMNDFSLRSSGRQSADDRTSFRCPKSHGLYRDPEDCRVFYRCFSGRPVRQECRAGTVFSTQRGFCTRPQFVPDCQEMTSSRGSLTSRESRKPTPQNHRHDDSSSSTPCHHRHHHHHQDEGQAGTSYFTSPDVTRRGYDDVSAGVREGREREEEEEEREEWKAGDVSVLGKQGSDEEYQSFRPIPVSDWESSDFTCPREVFNGFFPDPVSCGRFYRCFRGRLFPFICPPGTFYHSAQKLCNFQHKVTDCDSQGRRLAESWTSKESDENEVEPWPGSDSEDSWKHSGTEPAPKVEPWPGSDSDDSWKHSGTEPAPSEWQMVTEQGPKPEREHSRERMSEPSPHYISNSLCPGSDGLFAHPSSCRKFVYCSRGAPVVLTCPSELLYNTETMTCDYNENIICLRYDK